MRSWPYVCPTLRRAVHVGVQRVPDRGVNEHRGKDRDHDDLSSYFVVCLLLLVFVLVMGCSIFVVLFTRTLVHMGACQYARYIKHDHSKDSGNVNPESGQILNQ